MLEKCNYIDAMKLLDEKKGDFDRQLKNLLTRPAPDRDPSVVGAVAEIIDNVAKDGDDALFDYCRKFDKADLDSSNVEVSLEEIEASFDKVPEDLLRAIETAHRRVMNYHEHQLEKCRCESFEYADETGIKLGMRVEPLTRVGIYVPGGKAAYPSSVLMAAVPAALAGVDEIIMVSPQRGDAFHPHLAAAASIAGVDRVFRIGGAQAVAALAFGTESIPRVDKIVGPGNAYVACAKRMLYGQVDIDMVAGPSEVLIISDGGADPAFIAADLLSQAEHDETARPIFITTGGREAEAVVEEVARRLETIERNEIAKKAVDENGAVILVKDLDGAARIANMIAPEHLEILCEKPRKLADKIKYAGAIFIGEMTPEPLGDYIAGPNHILPTGGSARFRGPLGVYDFFRRSSVMEADKKSFLKMADDVVTLAKSEGLGAHAQSVLIRLAKEKPKK